MDILAEQQIKMQRSIHFVHAYLSAPLYLLFLFADLIYIAQSGWKSLLVRGMIVPLCVIVALLNRRISSLRQLEYLAVFSAFGHGLIITALIYLSGGFYSGYYAGLNLVMIGAITVVRFSKNFRYLAIAVIVIPYYAICSLQVGTDTKQYAAILLNSFFIFGTAAISLFMASFQDHLQNKEHTARLLLKQEIANRDQTIRAQIDSSVHLRLLSRQFSPQVVKAIQSGKVADIRPIQRQKICVIFVDIENSTSRIIRLDKDDVGAVISMFMHDVMSILLKYDITIDKFLGDGVLAFSNHPVPSDDFIQRVVNAGLEIRARIMERREEYLEYWKNELRITIGIDVGYANVGFYGGGMVPQTYTAIGEVVNFAKRLSDSAEPNQMLISHSACKLLPRQDYEMTLLGERRFKGFENDIIPVYEIKQGLQTTIASGINLCPTDSSVMYLAKNGEGIYILKCRECGFVLADEHGTARVAPAESDHAAA